MIKELEDRFLSVMKKKAELLIERRRQDVVDAVEECAGKVDPARHTRIVEREGRRRRRREIRSRANVNLAEYNEGESSDDELLESTRLKFQSEIGKCVEECENSCALTILHPDTKNIHTFRKYVIFIYILSAFAVIDECDLFFHNVYCKLSFCSKSNLTIIQVCLSVYLDSTSFQTAGEIFMELLEIY